MRTLLLMRHAKSSWADDALPDEERPLNDRGKAAALRMGKFLRHSDLAPELVLVSPAKRARQTAQRVIDAGAFDAPIVQHSRLYFAGLDAYFDAIALTPNTVTTLLVVGHNPDLETFVARIRGGPERMPTAAIARIFVETGDWRAACDTAACKLVAVYRPKDLRDPD